MIIVHAHTLSGNTPPLSYHDPGPWRITLNGETILERTPQGIAHQGKPNLLGEVTTFDQRTVNHVELDHAVARALEARGFTGWFEIIHAEPTEGGLHANNRHESISVVAAGGMCRSGGGYAGLLENPRPWPIVKAIAT